MAIENITKRHLAEKRFTASLHNRKLNIPITITTKKIDPETEKTIESDMKIFFEEKKNKIKGNK